MGTRDPRVDAYIEKSADFAKPILTHLRSVIHESCPDVEETIKWGAPTFMHHGILCGMAVFKQHCALNLWKGALVLDGNGKSADAMGQFGRIMSVKDLPAKRVMVGYLKQAVKLNEQGVKTPNRSGKPKALPPMPAELTAALAKNRTAKAAFDAFSPSRKREYIDWISEAKGEDTRQRRLTQAIEWISEGKSRNWKYEKR